MISVSGAFEVGSISVMTSEDGGLSSEQIAELARQKILYISEDAPPAIKEQAKAFSDKVEQIVLHYLNLAKREERATICQTLRKAGHTDIAEYIRRL